MTYNPWTLCAELDSDEPQPDGPLDFGITAANNILIVYNADEPDSVEAFEYYRDHRPGMSDANVLGLHLDTPTVTTFGDFHEQIEYADYLTKIAAPVCSKYDELLGAGRRILYVICMHGMATRVMNTPRGSPGGGPSGHTSLCYVLSRAVFSATHPGWGYNLLDEYSGPYYSWPFFPGHRFLPSSAAYFPPTAFLVSHITAVTLVDVKAYIDKLNAAYRGRLIISGARAGLRGGRYWLDDARRPDYANYLMGEYNLNGMPAGDAKDDASASYAPTNRISTPAANGFVIRSAADVSGYMSWGIHAWQQNNRVLRLDTNGANFTQLIYRDHLPTPYVWEPPLHPMDVALDVANSKLYWTEQGPGTTFRRIGACNLDGTNPTTPVAYGGQVGTMNGSTNNGAGKVRFIVGNAKNLAVGLQFKILKHRNVTPGQDAEAYNDDRRGGVPHTITAVNVAGSWVDTDTDFVAAGNDGTWESVPRLFYDAEGVALDVAGNKLYWSDPALNADGQPPGRVKIARAALDGSGVEVLYDHTHSIGVPYGLALDLTVSPKQLYWADGNGAIKRAAADGMGTITTVRAGLNQPRRVRLDVANGDVYWTELGAGRICVAKMDGSGGVTVLRSGLSSPYGLELDLAAGKMYWTESPARGLDAKLCVANLNGSGAVTSLATWCDGEGFNGLTNPYGLALDVAAGKLYVADWINYAGREFSRDGTLTFGGRSNWYITRTNESFCGQRLPNDGQHTLYNFYRAEAMGGAGYSVTPAGAIGYTDEPGSVFRLNSASYFGMWESGWTFVEAAWGSRISEKFICVGDPLVTV